MGDKNLTYITRISNRIGSSIVRSKTSGSRHAQNPRNKGGRRKTKQQDRISELPDSLLIDILSHLPSLNQIIRTGTLSKRWLNLWTSVPNLIFSPPSSNPKDFVADVTRTLAQFRGPKVGKFSILIPYRDSISSDVDALVRFTTRNNVDELSLGFSNNFMYDGGAYVLPQFICTNSSLKILELKACVFAPKGLVVGWNALKRLSLYGVILSDAAMEGIVTGCPVLETLEVLCYRFSRVRIRSLSLRELVLSGFVDHYGDYDGAYLKISAPNLLALTISSRFYTWDLRLEDLTSLVSADLSFYLQVDESDDDVEDYDKYLDLLQELIGKLCHVEELKLATWCIQALSVLEVRGCTSPLLNCRSLTLDTHIVDCDLPGLARLLDISPYLETLVMSTENSAPSEFFVGRGLDDDDSISVDGEDYFQLRKTIPEGFLLHLKNVKIFGFRRLRLEVELLRFLLKNAKVLETVNVYLQREGFECQSECCEWEEIEEIDDEELNLPVSSPHALVRFVESPEEFMEALKLETMLNERVARFYTG